MHFEHSTSVRIMPWLTSRSSSTWLVDRGRGEARPAAAGIELGVGFEQRLPAAGADIGARPVLVLVFAGERPLGRLLAQHRVLHRRQFLAPLGVAFHLSTLASDICPWLSEPCERSPKIVRNSCRQLVTLTLLTSVGFSI